jgi:hypothetical protein
MPPESFEDGVPRTLTIKRGKGAFVRTYKKREVNNKSPRTPRFCFESFRGVLAMSAAVRCTAWLMRAACGLPVVVSGSRFRRLRLALVSVREVRRPGTYRGLSFFVRSMKICERSTWAGAYSHEGAHPPKRAASSAQSRLPVRAFYCDRHPPPSIGSAGGPVPPSNRSSYSPPFFHIAQAALARSRATFRRAFFHDKPSSHQRAYRRYGSPIRCMITVSAAPRIVALGR